MNNRKDERDAAVIREEKMQYGHDPLAYEDLDVKYTKSSRSLYVGLRPLQISKQT